MEKEHEFETLIYEKQANICKAFANPIRLRILDMIAQRSCAASELQEELAISKANLSQHMTILKAVGVVSAHREGKQVYCALAIPQGEGGMPSDSQCAKSTDSNWTAIGG